MQTTGANLFDEKTVVDGFIAENGSLQPGNQAVRKERTSDYILLPESETSITATALGESFVDIGNEYLWTGLSFYDAGKNFLKRISNYAAMGEKKQVLISNIPQEAKYVRLSYRKYNDVVVMLNTGSVAKPYEPYTGGKPSPSPEYPQEITIAGENGTINLEITGENAEPQSLTLSTPNGLPGIKVNKDGNYTDSTGQQWVCDEIDLARGKYVKRIAWKSTNELNIKDAGLHAGMNLHRYTSNIELYDTTNHIKRYIPCISNKFSRQSDVQENTMSIETVADSGWAGYSKVTFLVSKDCDDVNKFKALIGDDFKIMYKLKTPIEKVLTPEEIEAFKNLHTNYPTTTIYNDENAHMELTYTVDTKTYVDTKIAEVSTAIVQKGI